MRHIGIKLKLCDWKNSHIVPVKAVLWIHIGFNSGQDLNADPEPVIQTNADQDSGQIWSHKK
jgi:hypothetical protein